jgi:hypothetical protein
MARTKLTPYQLELRRRQNDGARTERQKQLNQRISYLALQSDRERQRRRTLALAERPEQREQRFQARLISDDELDITNLLAETKSMTNTFDHTELWIGVLIGIILSLLFDLTQQIIANGH